MSDYPMLISNKLHSFRNFIMQIILLFSVNLLETITVLVDKRLIYSVVTFLFFPV